MAAQRGKRQQRRVTPTHAASAQAAEPRDGLDTNAAVGGGGVEVNSPTPSEEARAATAPAAVRLPRISRWEHLADRPRQAPTGDQVLVFRRRSFYKGRTYQTGDVFDPAEARTSASITRMIEGGVLYARDPR